MSRAKYVPSPAELAERRRRLEGGIPDGTLMEAAALRDKVRKLEGELERQQLSRRERGPTPLELRRDMDELFEHYGIEPAEELIRIATSKDDAGKFVLSPVERAEIWANLMQYRVPKLRAVEVSGTIKSQVTIQVVMFNVSTGDEERVSERVIDIGEGGGS